MAELEAVIGLEIHVQLATKTKMFCGCELSFGEEPNVHTCPICLAHPGVLPVPNEKAIRYALQIGAALNCEIAPRSIFHRKNYFYPDSPKAYQISQYDIPICGAGRLGDVRIHRAHLEEDAAKMIHVGSSGRIHGSGASLVDFNRGGTPLVEIVTEPDLRGAAEAADWARLLRETVRQLGVSDVNMEEGSLRVDANVSVRPADSKELGTKTELKNMNSFRFLQRGVEAELARQRELIEAGGTVEQETLHFDPASGSLTSLRSKEEAHDYRYFPEPDLVPLAPTEEMLREAREALPELPVARAARYESELRLDSEPARQLAREPEVAAYFERVCAEADADPEPRPDGVEPRVVANWITGDLTAELRKRSDAEDFSDPTVPPSSLAALVAMVAAREISHGSGRKVLSILVANRGGDPQEIVEREGLAQMSDSGELEAIVERAMADNPDAVEKIREGNPKAIGAIVGAVMRETKGRADGGEVNRLIQEKL
ncbi:MAG: aspartyl-tRNA(Asn)/glutamyl-tRNA(Gln) amidotransferase subunit [Solirubrobacterales bacterium]|jgi:aspartyl-tRNA(Asn)/glutamyl-tRNA(Gln) amidotransferase subunit B|nr:aspartyl-tRNA(Asn)/glutamyl-tRNA(Gln) amidotransferase subunit [Solirubrobacterales bacterium]